ncbi:DUF1684 domain-containing protein [Spirosoma sp. KUDC1026]|uniref:DUF1684 domain-containing protein n=1 Tax=Spirosoma sp. KUDC1026 TaxID=2745947 RepID=UPI00159BC81B|nr:DUF1684 domain-containing protein [Spirosoma sp. KUDC1026]QKZ14602.1 DUF1684 domain-containing protein [Spirosoma sp. KUDC1026]
MFTNKTLLTGLVVLVVAAVAYFFLSDDASDGFGTVDPNAYRQQVAASREKKNDFFRTSAESPFTDKTSFSGLRYFSPDPAYRVVARLEPFADKTQKLVVTLTDGSEEVYDKYAHAVFSLNGEACRLLIVKLKDTYSILFRDATSGKTTYGGGRYLELDPKLMQENRAVLDFNAAYNPYCAYNPGFACPLPPKENNLPIAIEAGEQYVAHE